MKICQVTGCGSNAVGFGVYCATHKARSRRHGHPDQKGITKAEIAAYVRLVEARKLKNADNPIWSLLGERWAELTKRAGDVLASYRDGKPASLHEVRAAQEVLALTEAVVPETLLSTALAMFIFRDLDPRRFRSDDAFTTQLVRRLRGLSEVNAGTWFDHNAGRVKRVYRELSPGTAAVLAAWIVPVVGPVGLRLASLERRDREAQRATQDEIKKAMETLQ